MRIPRKLKKRLRASLTMSPRDRKRLRKEFGKFPVMVAVVAAAYRAAAKATYFKIRMPPSEGQVISLNKRSPKLQATHMTKPQAN
jgi:hypothetical protein